MTQQAKADGCTGSCRSVKMAADRQELKTATVNLPMLFLFGRYCIF